MMKNLLIVLAYVIVIALSLYNRMNKGKTPVEKKPMYKTEEGVYIPKIIYTFWHSEEMPFLVKKCIESWKKHCPGYEIRIMNYENTKHIHVRHKDSHPRYTDYVRLHCLAETGGVWMDASTFMNKPLDSFLKDGHFNAYYLEDWTTNKDWPVIESWFMAAPKRNKFVCDWKEEFFRSNEFENMGDYVDDLIHEKGVDTQNIIYIFLNYVAIHMAAQYCIQKKPPYEKMNIMKAEDDAYMYLKKNDWDVEKSVEDICKGMNTNSNIIKFRGLERKYLKDECVKNLSKE